MALQDREELWKDGFEWGEIKWSEEAEKAEEINSNLKDNMDLVAEGSDWVKVVTNLVEAFCHLETEKGKLEMDLKAASGIGDEELKKRWKVIKAQNKALRRALKDKYPAMRMLLNKLKEAVKKCKANQ